MVETKKPKLVFKVVRPGISPAAQTNQELPDAYKDIVMSMDKGVVAYDSDDRVVLANPRCWELLEVPARIFDKGQPRRLLVEYVVEHGYCSEEGKLYTKDIMAQFAPGKQSALHRKTPSGRIIRTVSKALPNGGSGCACTRSNMKSRHEFWRQCSKISIKVSAWLTIN